MDEETKDKLREIAWRYDRVVAAYARPPLDALMEAFELGIATQREKTPHLSPPRGLLAQVPGVTALVSEYAGLFHSPDECARLGGRCPTPPEEIP